MFDMKIEAIGKVISSRKEAIDDDWNEESACIELKENYPVEALSGLNDFSHAEILFFMDQVNLSKIETSARHPRNNTDWPKVGIFAQRGKNRPNQIGVTICKILKVEGRKVFLKGLDAVDGTLVLDIKPWMKEFGPQGPTHQPSWASELMRGYWEKETSKNQSPSMFDPITIDSENVKIRPLNAVSWEKLADGLLYDGSFHSRNWGIKTREDVKQLHAKYVSAWAAQNGNSIVFLSKDESEVLGMTNFMNVEPTNKMIEIGGTWINKKYQRSFVNTETKLALLQYAFETLNLNRVEFRIDSENFTSQKAVQRLGFQFDGLMPRRKINANGDVRDYVFYSVTDQSWPQVKSQILQLQKKSKLPEFELLQKINSLRKEGKAGDAFDLVQSALSRFPNSPELHYVAGCICDAFRTEAEAMPFYLRSLELGLRGFDRRDAILGLGSTYRSLGKYEESKKTFELGMKDFPEYRPYQVFHALTEFNLKHMEHSIRLLLEQLIETTLDQGIRSYEKALRFYSTRLNEVFE